MATVDDGTMTAGITSRREQSIRSSASPTGRVVPMTRPFRIPPDHPSVWQPPRDREEVGAKDLGSADHLAPVIPMRPFVSPVGHMLDVEA